MSIVSSASVREDGFTMIFEACWWSSRSQGTTHVIVRMQNFDLYQFSSSGHSDENKTTWKFNRQKLLPAKISWSTVNTCWNIKRYTGKHGTCLIRLQVTQYVPLLTCQCAFWMHTHLDRPELSCRCICAGVHVQFKKVPVATYQQVKT